MQKHFGYRFIDMRNMFRVNPDQFYKSGLAQEIKKVARGLYDAGDVDEWADRLARRRALVRLGALHPTLSLRTASNDDTWDTICPQCEKLAVFLPPHNAADEQRMADPDYPAACGYCNWQRGVEPPLTLADYEQIRQDAEGKICPAHGVQLAPVFSRHLAVIGWQCWACNAGLPSLTDEMLEINRALAAERERRFDAADDTAEFDPFRDKDED